MFKKTADLVEDGSPYHDDEDVNDKDDDKCDKCDDTILQGTSDLQLERINVYYNEATGGKYVPRLGFFCLQ